MAGYRRLKEIIRKDNKRALKAMAKDTFDDRPMKGGYAYEGCNMRFSICWRVGAYDCQVFGIDPKYFRWYWLFRLVLIAIYQFKEFKKPYPAFDSWAYKFWCVHSDIRWFFTWTIGWKIFHKDPRKGEDNEPL